MVNVLALQELPTREKEEDSANVNYSTHSWQTCV
jgi:hypothetical protein